MSEIRQEIKQLQAENEKLESVLREIIDKTHDVGCEIAKQALLKKEVK